MSAFKIKNKRGNQLFFVLYSEALENPYGKTIQREIPTLMPMYIIHPYPT